MAPDGAPAGRSADGSSATDEIDDADNADEPRTECQRGFGASFCPPFFAGTPIGNVCAFRRRFVDFVDFVGASM